MDKKLEQELESVLKRIKQTGKDATLDDVLAALERIEEQIKALPPAVVVHPPFVPWPHRDMSTPQPWTPTITWEFVDGTNWQGHPMVT